LQHLRSNDKFRFPGVIVRGENKKGVTDVTPFSTDT
jgi:hypothetical protein